MLKKESTFFLPTEEEKSRMSKKEIGAELQKEILRLDRAMSEMAIDRLDCANALKMLKLTGKTNSIEPPKKAKAKSEASVSSSQVTKAVNKLQALAIDLLKKGEVRPLDLAKAAKTRNEYASAALTQLVARKVAVKVKRGIYTIKQSKELDRRISGL
jgi:hypothetical protein